MPFIHSYGAAMKKLASIGKGTCAGTCKQSWMRNFRYALKTNTNPLGLTRAQRQKMNQKMRNVSGRVAAPSLKKYLTRKSPPYPANDHCNKQMKGNDGRNYISMPNRHQVCSWKPY